MFAPKPKRTRSRFICVSKTTHYSRSRTSTSGNSSLLRQCAPPLARGNARVRGISFLRSQREGAGRRGFYWSSAFGRRARSGTPGIPHRRADVHPSSVCGLNCSKSISDQCPFVVVDIALKENGEPIVIELNDGQMSGPSECNLDALYKGLANGLV
jgi:hypothetical protein